MLIIDKILATLDILADECMDLKSTAVTETIASQDAPIPQTPESSQACESPPVASTTPASKSPPTALTTPTLKSPPVAPITKSSHITPSPKSAPVATPSSQSPPAATTPASRTQKRVPDSDAMDWNDLSPITNNSKFCDYQLSNYLQAFFRQ